MKPEISLKGTTRIVLFGVALVGIFLFKLQLSKLGVIGADPARDLATAVDIVDGVKYPLVSPQLGGHLHSGPLYFYLLSIPLLISFILGIFFELKNKAHR